MDQGDGGPFPFFCWEILRFMCGFIREAIVQGEGGVYNGRELRNGGRICKVDYGKVTNKRHLKENNIQCIVVTVRVQNLHIKIDNMQKMHYDEYRGAKYDDAERIESRKTINTAAGG